MPAWTQHPAHNLLKSSGSKQQGGIEGFACGQHPADDTAAPACPSLVTAITPPKGKDPEMGALTVRYLPNTAHSRGTITAQFNYSKSQISTYVSRTGLVQHNCLMQRQC